MASLKDLRNRIASVTATQKITKAMQMVAAAKLRRAQEAAEAARPYSERMGAVLSELGSSMEGREGMPPLLVGTGKQDVHLLVVCTADRGLCGGFNASIAKHAREKGHELISQGKTVKIITVGKKGLDVLRRIFNEHIIDKSDFGGARRVGYEHADAAATNVLSRFENGEFDVCWLFYSKFHSVILQEPRAMQIIPADLANIPAGDKASDGADYEYEPDEAELLADLLPRNIAVQFFHAMLENAASEQGARMSAMDSATRNAGEMIDKLTQTYNRQRQAQITKELIEIISGAEAL